MAESHLTGKQGEAIALKHLQQKGYAVLETNWQAGHKEIDIIARKDDLLVIVEVKSRKTAFFGEPEEFVSRSKQKLLIAAANQYLEKNDLDLEVRFDIISVLFKGENFQVHHIEDAFYPTL
ncbi:MAG: YraN family protein [Bacteroides sp.]|jgi:putative endonuclease|nr:YraN family protein [Bacteroides sp.]